MTDVLDEDEPLTMTHEERERFTVDAFRLERQMSREHELAQMRALDDAMEQTPVEARARVLGWLVAKWGERLQQQLLMAQLARNLGEQT